jgi:cell division protein FtsB
MSRRRPSKAVRPRFITAGRVGTVVLLAAALWLGSGLVSRMVLAYRLNSTVKAMQVDNRKLVQANQEYQQQLQALSRPDGAEEQARSQHYVRPDEKVYVVVQPSPSPGRSPSPAARPPVTQDTQPASTPNFWGDLWSAITSPFR